MGKWKAFIPVVSAIIFAAFGSGFIYKLLQARSESAALSAVRDRSIAIVVANEDIAPGSVLTRDMLKTAPFLKESLPSGYLSDLGGAIGRVAITAFKMREPVLEAMLAPKTITEGGLSALIKLGQRAMAVKGDKLTGLSGLIKPGNRVDVLVTFKDGETRNEVTKIVLSDVLVMATGNETAAKPSGKYGPEDVYILEVSPEQAKRLALATTEGKIQFALRSIAENKYETTKKDAFNETFALNVEDPSDALKVKERKKPDREFDIEIIKGNSVTWERFRNYH